MNVLSTLFPRAASISALVLLTVSATVQAGDPVQSVQSGYAGAEAGDWGGKNGAPVGPADDTCANMGAVGKVNLLSGFGFNLPGDAFITGVAAYVKSGSSGGQSVGLQLASQAAVDPPTTVGTVVNFPTTDVGSGNCASTVVTSNGPALSAWGNPALTPVIVNSSAFGLVFTKLETSEVKVDAVCLEIEYTTPAGNATTEDCFEVVTPEANEITVVKSVVGAAPGSDWDFDPDWDDPFTLPAGGGFRVFGDLTDGLYSITEIPKKGYEVSVECVDGDTVVATGTNSVIVDLDEADEEDDLSVTCIFTNREIIVAPPVVRTTFTVQKLFSDGNSNADVTIHIQCFTGLPLNQQQSVSTDNNGEFEVEFVVESFEQGALDCNIFEDDVPGYTSSYQAESNVAKPYGEDEDGCFFENIDTSNFREGEFQNACYITNDPEAVEVTVTKDWEVEGAGGDALDPTYSLTLWCDNPIEDGYSCDIKNGGYYDSCYYASPGTWYKDLTEYGTGDTDDADYTAHVVPDWEGGTYCWVEEEVYDNSVEVDDSDCVGEAGLDVELAGEGDNECTIVNTVFYEGIPTLSQYGMAIMALLMLGMGMVGFRRFV
jgi:hypothetical protein